MSVGSRGSDARKAIPLCEPSIGEHELELMASCVKSTWVSSVGPYVDEFESRLAARLGVRRGVACSSGTAALHLALYSLGIGPGDEVIVPAATFIATANVVRYVGATPVVADVTRDTWTLDPEMLPLLATERTRAVIPVHLYGHPADMAPILEWARERNAWVIEDATEALGARYKRRQVGVLGHIGCFSFNGNKLITTGSGGMAVTDNPDWGERLSSLASQARAPGREYRHTEVGFNYRLTNVQAALGLAQLDRIEEILRAKQAHARHYRDHLAQAAGIEIWPSAPWAEPDYWLLGIVLRDYPEGTRDRVIDSLAEEEIASRPFFLPVHLQPAYEGTAPNGCPVATWLWQRSLLLPSSADLTDSDIDRVCSALLRALGRQGRT